MDFNFGKNILDRKNIITQNENKDIDDKLDNIYESIQNIVFNEPKINKINSNKKNYNIEPNIVFLQNEKKNNINHDNSDEEFVKNKKDNINNIFYNYKNTKQMQISNNNNNNFIKLKFLNDFETNKKNLNDNLLKIGKNNEDTFSFRNNFNNNEGILLNTEKKNKFNKEITSEKNISKNEEKIIDKEILDFCNIIKSKSHNLFKINTFEKQHYQKQILRLKLEAFLVIKKYYLHRKSKSSWKKKKKKLIKLSENFYRNLLLSRTFYGFVLNSKRKSLYNLIKNNYIDFRIKELSSFLIRSLKF